MSFIKFSIKITMLYSSIFIQKNPYPNYYQQPYILNFKLSVVDDDRDRIREMFCTYSPLLSCRYKTNTSTIINF